MRTRVGLEVAVYAGAGGWSSRWAARGFGLRGSVEVKSSAGDTR